MQLYTVVLGCEEDVLSHHLSALMKLHRHHIVLSKQYSAGDVTFSQSESRYVFEMEE